MMKTILFRFNFVFPFLCFVCVSTLDAQVSMGFENLSTSQNCTSTSCNYTDPISASSAHVLIAAGGIPVSSASSGTVLGFLSRFVPTRTGGSTTGLNDGDFFGYATSATVAANVGQNAVQGAQAFIAEDTDGQVIIEFDPVNLDGAGSPMFSMNYIVDGSFESSDGANDMFYIGLQMTGCPNATTIDLLDANGTGAGGSTNMNDITDQTWFPLSQNLTSYVGCNAKLIVEIDLNSSTEEVAIDNIVFSAGTTVLPVELLRFEATNRDNTTLLEWATSLEINNDKFEIEESRDGRSFYKIGEVKGNGTQTVVEEYSFTVTQALQGLSYYRLKQMDYDGVYEYSDIVAVTQKAIGDRELKFYPNPTTSDRVHLKYTAENDEIITVAVFDVSGEFVLSQTSNVVIGTNKLSFDFSELKRGIYYVSLREGAKLNHAKLVIL